MVSLYRAYYELRGRLADGDWLYPALIRALALRQPRLRTKLAGKHTDIVIEGIPRSANTFFASYFHLAQEGRCTVASHLHESYQIRYATRHDLPCVILIRHLDETIPSAVLRNPRFTPRLLLNTYLQFYKNCWEHRGRAVIARFTTATKEPASVIAAVNDTYGTHFRLEPVSGMDAVYAEVAMRDRRSLGDRADDPLRLALPSIEKEEQKKKYLADLHSPGLAKVYDEAVSYFNRFYELSI